MSVTEKVLQCCHTLKIVSDFLDHKTKKNVIIINKNIYEASYHICYEFWSY